MSYPKTTLPTLDQPSSTYASLIEQSTALIPEFTLESGETLTNVPVAFKTWGKLNPAGDNVMIICHALTGSADVEDWWGPLLGPGKAFDPTRYFIFCANVIGSPYGTVSSVTINPETGKKWGPELTGSSVKDDVRLHKLVLDSLGVNQVAVVIGGSMGGMTTLEYPLNTPSGYIRHIIPIATSARHSAWCISWGEAQRQSIYSDPAYDDGYYCFSDQEEEEDDDEEDDLEGKGTTTYKSSSTAYPGETEQERKRRIEERQPTRGLAAARMAALLTYRSRDSFESRFGRKYGGPAQRGRAAGAAGLSSSESGRRRRSGQEASGTVTPREDNLRAHNDGHRARKDSTGSSKAGTPTLEKTREVLEQLQVPLPTVVDQQQQHDGAGDTESLANQPGLTNLELSMPGGSRSRTPVVQENGSSRGIKLGTGATRQVFSAQSYLRYQGDKFTSRFDANCYIHITRKMDTHDISFPSYISTDPSILSHQLPMLPSDATEEEQTSALAHALSLLPPALVMGIESDGLFTTREQREIARSIRDSELVIIPSPDGHDGFLLEFEAINTHIQRWLKAKLPEIYEREPLVGEEEVAEDDGFGVKKESLFGEAEADITRW